MSLDFEKVIKIASSLKSSYPFWQNDLITKYSFANYSRYLLNRPELRNYTYIPSDIKSMCNEIEQTNGKLYLQLYHKTIILALISHNILKLRSMDLPTPVKQWYLTTFEMILEELKINADSYYDLQNDNFVKDLNICQLKLIPAGPSVIELSAVPYRFLLKSNTYQFMKGMLLICFHTFGFKPFYRTHFYLRGLADFNEYEWDQVFLLIAQLLRYNHRAKGLFRAGWFLDPQLETISPRLAYLRERIVQNGGEIFYLGVSPEDVNDATLKSPTRRRLYREGKYIPTKYMAIWPRKHMLKWAENYREINEGISNNP